MDRPEFKTSFSDSDMDSFRPAMKIGLLATVNPKGQPHVTLLSSLMAPSPRQVCFGQFTEGFSKQHIRQNPQAGFLVMSLDKNLWRGKASFSHTAKEGTEYDFYNNIPMFRYNAYFGIHTVYYFNLVSHTGKEALPMNNVIFAAILTMLARTLSRRRSHEVVLNSWTQSFLNKIDNLKFLAYIGDDGFPVLVPAIQVQCLDKARLLFSTPVYREELEAIPAGANLAVFGMSLSMEDVLLRGQYQGIQRVGGVPAGIVAVEWIYNSMPPAPGQVYPPVEIQAVQEW